MSLPAPLRQVKPKNNRTKRYLDNKAPLQTENPRQTLFLKGTKCSDLCQLVLKDLHSLKRPLATRFSKKNNIHPFEDASSLEFFADKNDCSLMVFGSHSKKRPHCLTLARFFDYKILDMLELMVEPETARTLAQFKNGKPAVGLKPLISFSGTAFESPVENEYTLAKSLLLELFKGPDAANVDVEGLQYLMCFSVEEEVEGQPKPAVRMRCYLIKTKKTGGTVPRVETEEMGPRVDFRIGRMKQADPEMLKEAMRKPKGTEAKTKKNIETDVIGDKVGRIHVGKQSMDGLQTRKMKGLKRSRDVVDNDGDAVMAGASEDEMSVDQPVISKKSKVEIEEV